MSRLVGIDLLDAQPHYRDSIRLMEASGNLYGAGATRFNVAKTQQLLALIEQALAASGGR